MQIQLLKSKLHKALVTSASLDYEGSLTIDQTLMDAIDLKPYEKILCSNVSNGERFETYAIAGPAGSGIIQLNGATARLGQPGDLLIIMSFAIVDIEKAKDWKPRVVILNGENKIK